MENEMDIGFFFTWRCSECRRIAVLVLREGCPTVPIGVRTVSTARGQLCEPHADEWKSGERMTLAAFDRWAPRWN